MSHGEWWCIETIGSTGEMSSLSVMEEQGRGLRRYISTVGPVSRQADYYNREHRVRMISERAGQESNKTLWKTKDGNTFRRCLKSMW